MGIILDGFIGLSELTATAGKVKFRVYADTSRVKRCLKEHGIKATVLAHNGMSLVALANKRDEHRAEILLEQKFG